MPFAVIQRLGGLISTERLIARCILCQCTPSVAARWLMNRCVQMCFHQACWDRRLTPPDLLLAVVQKSHLLLSSPQHKTLNRLFFAGQNTATLSAKCNLPMIRDAVIHYTIQRLQSRLKYTSNARWALNMTSTEYKSLVKLWFMNDLHRNLFSLLWPWRHIHLHKNGFTNDDSACFIIKAHTEGKVIFKTNKFSVSFFPTKQLFTVFCLCFRSVFTIIVTFILGLCANRS